MGAVVMIQFDEGKPTLCGRVTWGFAVGHVIAIDRETYRVRWMDGAETEQLRPDDEEEE
jgi:hypothetical protein